MRLFTALLPPPGACAGLAELVGGTLRGRAGAEGLRWTEPEGWHLTLAFFGEVDAGVLPALEARLERAARRHGPYELRLAGGGRFGERALWAGVTGPEGDAPGDLAHLAASVRAAARREGIDVAGEAFRAHLTLARTRPGRPRVDLAPYAAALDGFAGPPWTCRELHLVRSDPPEPGVPGARPRYRTIGTWPLGGT
jgi:2'-5' RNA ligase